MKMDEIRSKAELNEAEEKYFELNWFGHHKDSMRKNKKKDWNPEILEKAQAKAKDIEGKYPEEVLGYKDAYQWGMLQGKLSALRWMIGDDWDNLDT